MPPKAPPALDAFATAWNRLTGYTATATIFEQSGSKTQTMVFDYSFQKPSSVDVRVVAGANAGARLAWKGGSTAVVRRGSGLLSLFHRTVSLHDPLITTIRGSTIDELSFGAILAHAREPGVLSERTGDVVADVSTEAVTLVPTDPKADADLTREVIELSTKTHLPTRILGYTGSLLARKIDFTDVRLRF